MDALYGKSLLNEHSSSIFDLDIVYPHSPPNKCRRQRVIAVNSGASNPLHPLHGCDISYFMYNRLRVRVVAILRYREREWPDVCGREVAELAVLCLLCARAVGHVHGVVVVFCYLDVSKDVWRSNEANSMPPCLVFRPMIVKV